VNELSEDITEFLGGSVSVLAASRDAELRPWISRAIAVRVGDDRRSVVAYLSDRAAAPLIGVLSRGVPFAVTACHVPTLRTVQLKGVVQDVRPAAADERASVERQSHGFTEDLSRLGFPLPIVRRLAIWPVTAVTVRVHAVFEQTPGPGAGRPITP
jgi:hypothetical protein